MTFKDNNRMIEKNAIQLSAKKQLKDTQSIEEINPSWIEILFGKYNLESKNL